MTPPPVTDAPVYCRTTFQHCNLGRTLASRKRRPTSTDRYCEEETRNFRGIDTGDTAMGRDLWVTKNARRSLMRQPSRSRLRFYRQPQKIARKVMVDFILLPGLRSRSRDLRWSRSESTVLAGVGVEAGFGKIRFRLRLRPEVAD